MINQNGGSDVNSCAPKAPEIRQTGNRQVLVGSRFPAAWIFLPQFLQLAQVKFELPVHARREPFVVGDQQQAGLEFTV